ncbi:MAG: phospholipid scramblase-related protein [Polyangiales bacterium]
MSMHAPLSHYPALVLRQRKELAELFGYESRNKYEVLDPNGAPILYAAEQGKGVGAMVMRQFFGHWRTFELHVFDSARNVILRAVHPFRWFFQRLEVFDANGRPLGALQQRWAIFSKRFDVEDAQGNVLMTVNSPLWRPWTFRFERAGQQVASVLKKWGGALTELFTDADKFRVEFEHPGLSADDRALLLCAGLFIDLQYFEAKAQSSVSTSFD